MHRSVRGLVVMIVACQVIDPGSMGERNRFARIRPGQNVRTTNASICWSSGMIPALSAGGRELDSRITPVFLLDNNSLNFMPPATKKGEQGSLCVCVCVSV